MESVGTRVKQQLAQLGFRQIIRRASHDPQRTVRDLLKVASHFTRDPVYRHGIELVAERVNDDPRVLRKIRLLLKNPHVLETMFTNWVLNSLFITAPMRRKLVDTGQRNPSTLQVDPTSACNLRCPGCWAGKYEESDSIEPERLDRLFEEMKELGIYWVVLSGGEPLIYPHLLELMEKHNDMAFMAYTNGTLLDDDMADELA
ncbi:MAG: radical SAM protein, partial [Bacillota bacterium]